MADDRKESATTDDFNLLESVAGYIKEADTLDLSGKELGIQEVRYILNILHDTQVTELNLERNHLANGMVDLSSLLIKTKIKKLNVSECRLTKEDLLQLAEALKDSQVTDLDVSKNGGCDFSLDEGLQFASHLKRSKLTTLISDFSKCFPQIGVSSFFREFSSSSITNLDLSGSKVDLNGFMSLFESLGHSSVTDLNLQATRIPREALQELSRRLADLKIEKLNLGRNNLKDDDLDVLTAGLVNSQVIELDLTLNSFTHLRPLFTRLKETQIKTLNLRYNYCLKNETFIYPDHLRCSSLASLNLRSCNLSSEAAEGLMESLRFSNVKKLDISSNNQLHLTSTVKKFAENVSDINLTELDLSHNLLLADAFSILACCLKESRLTRLSLNNMLLPNKKPALFFSFLKLTEGSCLTHIEMIKCPLILSNHDGSYNVPRGLMHLPSFGVEPQMLRNTTFTELQLSSRSISDGLSVLVKYLKYSKIAQLHLADNKITDDGVADLANCLKEMQVRRLNLDKNLITSEGAKALAVKLKDSHLLYLHLNENKIENDGLESLAEHAKNTLISVLDVAENPGKKVMLVEKVLWQNKTAIQKEVCLFKRIAPKTVNGEFCFDQNIGDSNIRTFLNKCLWFCKVIIDDCNIGILLREAMPFSKEQILKLMLEEFPLQFSQFIAHKVEADVLEHVCILEKAEEDGLTAVVRELLYNREAYLLDRENGILHPYAYKLLRKYNHLIFSPVEPGGATKVIEYFTKHPNIEGAQDVINLLRDGSIS